jgi:hypothetical protein
VAPKVPEFLPDCSPFVSVYSGRACGGFIINHGRCGFEAFDADHHSLGLFATEKAAADAISISDLAKENPGTAARGQMPGLIPWQHLQANAAGTRLARQSASRPCRCTTPRPRRQVWSKSPGGTYSSNAGPDAPDGLARPRGYMRAA